MQRPVSVGERYSRQERFLGIGASGQQLLGVARIAVIGCGGLGAAAISLLARAGVGSLVIVDRDVVELSNLHRQVLYDEADAVSCLPKAIAAAAAVGRINSNVRVQPYVADVTAATIESIIDGATVVVDATDNLPTRYLLNDACMKAGIPWVYGGAIGSTGMAMTILPGETPCFRCLFPNPPPDGTDTCDTTGVLASSVVTVAAHQWTEVIKLAIGARDQVLKGLLTLDVWTGDREVIAEIERQPDCPCCVRHEYEFLNRTRADLVTTVLGTHAVQVSPAEPAALDLVALTAQPHGAQVVSANEFAVRLAAGGRELIVFSDGRVIIDGTADAAEARSLYLAHVAR